MVNVTAVEGSSLGWRVVRADRQVVAGLIYYLQIEVWTVTRCEVHERRVYIDLEVRCGRMGGCTPSYLSIHPSIQSSNGPLLDQPHHIAQ